MYTALFGGYEHLVEQPARNDSNCDFVCFTDDPGLESRSWKLVRVEPALPTDPARSVRQLKIIGHELLSESDESLWIDNRIVLKKSPELLMANWLEHSELAAIAHSDRESVEAEFAAVLNGRLDNPARVREQLAVMKTVAPSVLDEVPLWGAIIARKKSPNVDYAMRVWMDSVLRYSRRDQLSFNYALHRSKLSVNVVELPNRQSEWHQWLTTNELPKDKRQRYGSFYEYGLSTHCLDSIKTSRIVRHLRWRLSR